MEPDCIFVQLRSILKSFGQDINFHVPINVMFYAKRHHLRLRDPQMLLTVLDLQFCDIAHHSQRSHARKIAYSTKYFFRNVTLSPPPQF